MKTKEVRSRYLSASERRAEAVAAVVDLAAERNPENITTTEIARHMGLTQGALFRHFATKDAILKAVMEWVSGQFLARLEKPAKEADSGLEGMERVFLGHARFVADHPGVPRMIFGELQRGKTSVTRPLVESFLGRYRKLLRGLIEQGKAEGALAVDLDVEAAITLFIGMIQGLVVQSLMAGDMGRIRLLAPRIFAIYRRGIERRARK